MVNNSNVQTSTGTTHFQPRRETNSLVQRAVGRQFEFDRVGNTGFLRVFLHKVSGKLCTQTNSRFSLMENMHTQTTTTIASSA